jgi:hypothetical protein
VRAQAANFPASQNTSLGLTCVSAVGDMKSVDHGCWFNQGIRKTTGEVADSHGSDFLFISLSTIPSNALSSRRFVVMPTSDVDEFVPQAHGPDGVPAGLHILSLSAVFRAGGE